MNVRALNETHDRLLRSWVSSANDPKSDFPVQNLPLGVFYPTRDSHAPLRVGIAIGDAILDLDRAAREPAFWETGEPSAIRNAARAMTQSAARARSLNQLAEMPHAMLHELRLALSRALRAGSTLRDALEPALLAQGDASMVLPVRPGNFTDFYSSIHHATAVGKLFRPEQPLFPNYKWLPVGYHGRASSVVVSGTPIPWPSGQRLPTGAIEPELAPSERLDYETELCIVVGAGNRLGRQIPVDLADEHIFGLCLLNDWSARDIQAWEYQPLGPFLGKSFATTVSPWIVTLEALAPFLVPARRSADDPQPLPYLSARQPVTYAIDVAASVTTGEMRAHEVPARHLASASYTDAYWTPAQLVAHHTVNGCNLRPGDLLGTGTLSGPEPHQAGSLLELSSGGRTPLPQLDGRSFLAPGDEVILRGRAVAANAVEIGFGECRGVAG